TSCSKVTISNSCWKGVGVFSMPLLNQKASHLARPFGVCQQSEAALTSGFFIAQLLLSFIAHYLVNCCSY
ncbi:hypothetical protein, partial [Undibacterium seohonense]|uniref:hypothetical protein n=1 Tax=Undibacterium seohonense TaxID=1344950 RepID=UPI001C9B18C0